MQQEVSVSTSGVTVSRIELTPLNPLNRVDKRNLVLFDSQDDAEYIKVEDFKFVKEDSGALNLVLNNFYHGRLQLNVGLRLSDI